MTRPCNICGWPITRGATGSVSTGANGRRVCIVCEVARALASKRRKTREVTR